MSSDELARVARLGAVFDRPSPGVMRGIGDDAAVLAGDGAPLVWTVDAQVEGTHFRLAWLSWEDVGWRSFMAAASDLAAMGAEPVAALSSLVLAPSVDDASLDALARGQAAAADAVGAPVVGGNLARGTETSVTTTLLGRAARPLLRSGARPGDQLFLCGAVGLAAAGLRALEAGHTDGRLDPALEAWRRPRALVREAAALREAASAAVDVSDGLARDASHLAEASDVRLVLDEPALRAALPPALGEAAGALGVDALDLALHGGEDYALLATGATAPEGFARIGAVEAAAAGPRLWLARQEGTVPLAPRGFDHFG